MTKLCFILVSALCVIIFFSPVHAAYQKQQTMFSVEGIYQSLRGNYGLTSCRNQDFKSMARSVYNYLMANGKGATYAPLNCDGLVVEFVNTGRDVLDVHVRGK